MTCFVTAGAIDLKLCTNVPLGKSNSQAKFWSSLILGLANAENTKSQGHRGQSSKHITKLACFVTI
jgi:hypothetical protein